MRPLLCTLTTTAKWFSLFFVIPDLIAGLDVEDEVVIHHLSVSYHARCVLDLYEYFVASI